MKIPQSAKENRRDEQGFMLLGLVVAMFLILLTLGVAAPRMAQQLRRDRELEAVHRGDQYVRAIRLYYRKFGHYPGSIDQLEKSNNIRFLRQKYIDPMTGKDDWRLIHMGEQKTTMKGFFGQPLTGLAPGLGSAAGMVSQGIGTGQTVNGAGGTSNGTGATGSPGNSSPFSSNGGFSSTSTLGPGTSGPGTTGPGSTTAMGSAGSTSGSQSSGPLTGGGGLIVGVGSSATGDSQLDLNEQTSYQTWEFIYDPRIEQLYAKATLLGGVPTGNAGGLGSATGNLSPIGGSNGTSTQGTTPNPPANSSGSSKP